jgi:cell fate regulator YaaT (PSP1 superfamily)
MSIFLSNERNVTNMVILFRYFPLNVESSTKNSKEQKDEKGFTKIPSKRKTREKKKVAKRLADSFKVLMEEKGEISKQEGMASREAQRHQLLT